MSKPSRISSLFRRSVLTLAAVSVVGCEDLGATDKAALDSVDAALAQLSSLPSLAPGEGVNTVSGALTAAAGQASAGPAKIAAASAAAQVDQQAGYASAVALKKKEADVRRTLLDLRSLTARVAASAGYAAGYQNADPKEAIGQLSTHISSMQGNAQSLTWGGGEKPALPTVSAARQEASKLEGEIEQKQAQIADLTKKRTDLLATSSTQGEHAKGLKGDEAVRAYSDAAESKRQADDLGVDIDLVQVQLDRLKADLAIAKAQGDIVGTGVESLKAQGKLLEAGWVQVQKAAETQKGIVNALVEGDAQTKHSIKTTLATLSTQLADLAQARSAAIEQLNEAKKFADLATSEATTYGQSFAAKVIAPGKDAAAYKALKETIHPQMYRFTAGSIQSDRGTLELGQASLLYDVKSTLDGIKAAITAAGVPVPEAVAQIDTAAAEELLKSADTDLSEAVSAFTNVESGDSPKDVKTAAKTNRLITIFAQLRTYDLRAATGDTSTKDLITQAKSDGIALRDEIVADNGQLPALPGEFGTTPPPAPAVAPASVPATPTPAAEPAATPAAETPATPEPAAP